MCVSPALMFNNSTFRPQCHYGFRLVLITAMIINRLMFVTEMRYVFLKVGTYFLNIICTTDIVTSIY
jgi:hypothetical protein